MIGRTTENKNVNMGIFGVEFTWPRLQVLPKKQRISLEKQIRKVYNPKCGEQWNLEYFLNNSFSDILWLKKLCMKVEYLILKEENTYCGSKEAFLSLLVSNEDLKINGNTLKYKKNDKNINDKK